MMINEIELRENRRRIGQRIEQLRKQKNLTADQLGALSELNQQNVSRIEKGRYSTGIDIYYKISKALEVELKELF